ncbi:MAG TPA: ATP-binding protein [Candidatus Limnocylindrales bacterium]|nr:ATP-binding protein [Candidatus Limnocylindrales bacterium]
MHSLPRWAHYLVALIALSATVALAHVLRENLNQTAVALLLVLLVIFVAVRAGRGPAIFIAIVAGIFFNFFFIGPVYSLRIHRTQDIIAYVVFVVAAVLVGHLSSHLERRVIESEELQRSEQLKTALLDAVTHDLRTPLTSIKAAITTLRSGGVAEPVQRELEEVIDQEADRLNHFIQGMMDLARLEAGELSLQSRAVTADEIMEDALARAEPLLANHPVEAEVDPGLPKLSADPRLISQVLFTIIENAAKYSPPGTPISVSAARNGSGAVCFSIADQGPGIAPEMRDEVFRKFVRAGGRPGFGVGLAIARGIVEAHRGKIWIESGKGTQGTRVQFSVPAGDTA